MNSEQDIEQFQLLEEKIDNLIELITSLRSEKESSAEKFRIQEEKIVALAEEVENLRSGRDKAK